MNIALTLANISKWIAWGPVRITSIHGMNNQAGIVYIQLHEVPPKADGTLAAGAVPVVKSLQCLANAPFFFAVDFTLKELFLALSSTEVNYTAVAANGGVDATVVASSEFLCDGTEVVVGDLVTDASSLQVWTEAAGPKKLLRLDVVEQTSQNQFFVIEPTDADANVPTSSIFPIQGDTTVSCNFGTAGLSPLGKSANQTLRQGCTVRAIFPVPPVFPWGAGTLSMRAIYKS